MEQYLLARPEYSGAAPRPSAPIAYFEALPNAPKAGDKIAFDARASVDPAAKGLTYLWDFGDGTTGTGAQPQHAYATAGWYSPILVVRDAAGHEVGYQQSIDVGGGSSVTRAVCEAEDLAPLSSVTVRSTV